jgi:hypothetical protein
VATTVEYYDELVDAFGDSDSLTLLVVAGATRDRVARALEVDLHEPVCHPWDEDHDCDYAAWALVEIDGGVLAVEYTGYADPTVDALCAMSRGGGAAAVVRNNEQALLRFGCARDEELVVDAHGFLDEVPSGLQPLLDQVSGPAQDGFVVGLALAEVATGLELTQEQALVVAGAQFFKGPSLAPVRVG